jgi:hypothetical protein
MREHAELASAVSEGSLRAESPKLRLVVVNLSLTSRDAAFSQSSSELVEGPLVSLATACLLPE